MLQVHVLQTPLSATEEKPSETNHPVTRRKYTKRKMQDEDDYDEGDPVTPEKPVTKRKRKTKAPAASKANQISVDNEATEKSSSSKGKKKAKAATNEKYHKSAQEGKPEPCGQPPVWAEKRQQLCDTVSYYKAHQSGPYTRDNTVYGQLIDKEGEALDVFNDQVVITQWYVGFLHCASEKLTERMKWWWQRGE